MSSTRVLQWLVGTQGSVIQSSLRDVDLNSASQPAQLLAKLAAAKLPAQVPLKAEPQPEPVMSPLTKPPAEVRRSTADAEATVQATLGASRICVQMRPRSSSSQDFVAKLAGQFADVRGSASGRSRLPHWDLSERVSGEGSAVEWKWRMRSAGFGRGYAQGKKPTLSKSLIVRSIFARRKCRRCHARASA